MTPDDLQSLIDDASFDHAMGETAAALEKLGRATKAYPDSFEAWHALAEINFANRNLDEALKAAESAHKVRTDDLFINTTLSRIWMEKAIKPKLSTLVLKQKYKAGKNSLKKNLKA